MLGENIKRIRQEKGLTQEQLASELNIVRQTVSKWEKGLSLPDIDNLTKMSEVLNVSIHELLEAPKNENISLEDINAQLKSLTADAAKRRAFIQKVKVVTGVAILFIIIGAIMPRWNDMWYEFGGHIYNWTH